jgi:hypothetical protein
MLPQDVTTVLRKAAGPSWLVPFCAAGTEQIVVSVSAYATDATIDGRGRIANFGDGNFSVQGVPLGLQIPIPPEEVARHVASASHDQIAMLPELVKRELPHAAALAMWHLRTNLPTKVRNTRGSRTAEDIFVGYYAHWAEEFATADTTPGASRQRQTADWESDASMHESPRSAKKDRIVSLTLQPTLPASLVRVTMEAQ